MDSTISPSETKKLFKKIARNSDDKLSIIFGAGASLGYSRKRNYMYKPPAVSDLLSDENHLVETVIGKPKHRDINNQRAHIERSIRGSFNGDLEAYLSDIYANDTADERFPSMLRYLEDIFTTASLNIDLDDNHYQSILSLTRDLRGPRPWSILTFNYDTILEQSAESLPIFSPRLNFQSDSKYLKQNPKILKMHGGINFRYINVHQPEQNKHLTLHDIFTIMMDNKQSSEKYLELKGLGADVPQFIENRIFKDVGGRKIYNFPLMMIPVHAHTKSENSFFVRQIKLAKREISQSKLVVAIGYQFGDDTFINALTDLDLNDSTLILVGSTHLLEKTVNSRAYKKASKVWPKENIHIYKGNGFGEFVEALY